MPSRRSKSAPHISSPEPFCAENVLNSDTYDRRFAFHNIIRSWDKTHPTSVWCGEYDGTNDSRSPERCERNLPLRWKDVVDEKIDRAKKTIEYFNYFKTQVNEAMQSIAAVFKAHGATVYGLHPRLRIQPHDDRVYVAIYFDYLIAASADCKKTWQIPQFQAKPHHITLFKDHHLSRHIQNLEQRFEAVKEKRSWMRIAKWQKEDQSENYANQLYFKGHELARNLATYLGVVSNALREVIAFDEYYHISL